MSDEQIRGKRRERSPSLERALTSTKGRRMETSGEEGPSPASPERLTTSFKLQLAEEVTPVEKPMACFQDLPPEIVILGHLSVRDVLSVGTTCSRYHQTVPVWRRFCCSMPDLYHPKDWQRLAILKCEGSAYMEVLTPGLYQKMLGHQRALDPNALFPIYLPLPNKVVVSLRPVAVWCGLRHTLLLLQDKSSGKELHGCGCGTRGRLPGRPGGSHVFERLIIQVSRTARSICATKDWLFILSSHDITEQLDTVCQ